MTPSPTTPGSGNSSERSQDDAVKTPVTPRESGKPSAGQRAEAPGSTALQDVDGARAADSGSAASSSKTNAVAAGDGPRALAGPLTLRDLVYVLGALALLVLSFFPLHTLKVDDLAGEGSLWGTGLMAILPGVALPVAAAALLVVRRLSPSSELRVGSLSTDQFASVAAVAAFLFYLTFPFTLRAMGGVSESEPANSVLEHAPAWATFAGMAFSAVLVLASTLAPKIPFFAPDFAGRPDRDSHPFHRRSAAAGKPAKAPKAEAPVVKKASPDAPRVPHPTEDALGKELRDAAEQQAAPGKEQDKAPSVKEHDDASDLAPAAPEVNAARKVGIRGKAAPLKGSAPAGGAAESVEALEAKAEPAGKREPEGVSPSGEPSSTLESPQLESPEIAPSDTPSTEAPERAQEPSDATPAQGIPAVKLGQGPSSSPFWFAVGETKTVQAEDGGSFTLEPGEWHLALEDREGSYLVKGADGKVGVLEDLAHTQKA